MKEGALLVDVEPVRDACAVCMSRLNTSYLQDVTLFSWPLRRDVHSSVHRHYSEGWGDVEFTWAKKRRNSPNKRRNVLFAPQPATARAHPCSMTPPLEVMSLCARVSAAGGGRLPSTESARGRTRRHYWAGGLLDAGMRLCVSQCD